MRADRVGGALALAALLAGAGSVRAVEEDPRCAALAVSVDAMPDWYPERCPAAATPEAPWGSARLPGDLVYATCIFGAPCAGQFARFPLPSQTWTNIGPQAARLFAADFDLPATVFWAVAASDTEPDTYGTVNLATGSYSVVGTIAGPAASGMASGLKFDPTSSVVYLSTVTGASSELWTLNLATGVATLVGAMPGIVVDIAINASGQMFAHDIFADRLLSIDKATGAGTVIGPTGFDANFAQGMDFDPSDGTLYGFFFRGDTQAGGLVTFSTITGAATFVATSANEYDGAIMVPSASGTLTGTVTNAVTSSPIAGATVQAGPTSDTTDGSGVYSMVVGPGSYDLTASASGFISETAAGVVVTDGGTTTQDFALDPCPTITVSPATIPAGTAGQPYSQTFSQTGGNGAIAWSQSGTLPAGLSFNTSTATLSGTAGQIGSFPITVTATDANACTGSRGYALVIDAVGPFVPIALAVNASGNAVFEPGETVVVAPSWRNDTGIAQALSGVASSFTGPGGSLYTITDAAAVYGTVAPGATASCATTTNCYGLRLATPTSRPSLHWDSTVLETLSGSETKTWTLHVGNSFSDVATASPFYRFIEILLHKGITGGCGPTTYCPASSTAREQMAVFVLVAKEGSSYSPAVCSPPNIFGDVPETSPYCRWIEELSNRGVVSGCGGGNYCPGDAVTREQMAVFVLRTLDPTLDPPVCSPPNIFADVPETSPFCRWIEELANRGVVSGCGGGNYCPADPVSREQMGVFISVTFSLALYGP